MTAPTASDNFSFTSIRRPHGSRSTNSSSADARDAFAAANNSAPIPFPKSHLRRTISEVELEHANKMADWREHQMYHRLLTGMVRRSRDKGLDQHPKIIRSLENLMLTQASPIESLEPSSRQNEEWGVIADSSSGRRCSNGRDSLNSSNCSSCSSKGPSTSWSSAMGTSGSSSLSLRRRPSRSNLAPLKETAPLKLSWRLEEGIFDIEL